MLNTFQNAERQYMRRKERARHLAAIDSIASDPLFRCLEETNLAPAADALVGMPLVKLPPLRARDTGLDRRNRGKFTFALVVMVVLGAVLGVIFGVDSGEDENPIAPAVETTKDYPGLARYHQLFSLVLDWQVTPRSVLEDSYSYAAKALHWLAYEDLLSENVETIRTRYSLASLYFSTRGNSQSSAWNAETHWLSSYPVCLWQGVECLDKEDTIGLVHSLNLSLNGLVGSLPPELGLLELDCRVLDLSGNSLHGTIPDLSTLRNLQRLYLDSNDFTSSIPASIYQLSHLTHLYLNNGKLTGTIDDSIGDLTSLQGLSLHDNFLSGNLTNRIGDLRDLRILYLDSNSISGTIPTTIGQIDGLVDLRLRHNNFLGSIPSEIGNMRILQVCYLDKNDLSGEIPAEAFENLLLMRELSLYENRLTGPVPDSLGSMVLLGTLYLDENELNGEIPSSLGLLRYLESMFLYSNKLGGPIPTSFGSLESLEHLQLSSNELTGNIPSELGSLINLETLYLNTNYLDGMVPTEISYLSNLSSARFHGNRLSGIVPQGLCTEFIDSLVELTADCGNEISCTCCTKCYD